jgi:hypothetical protein
MKKQDDRLAHDVDQSILRKKFDLSRGGAAFAIPQGV